MKKIYLYCKFSSAVFKRISAIYFFVFSFSFFSYCQTNISGVVNTYHKVVEIIPAKACVRVANVTGLSVNTRVMLVQMKGASIITTNTSTFGDTTSLNQAGNYEIGTVCYIIGDSVFLFHNLLNTYNTSSGKVQLVQFAEYFSANVVDTVKAASWDSAAGTGGVIAIFCDEDLTLTKPIYADSSGYSGGAFLQSTGTCSDALPANSYVYNASTTSPQNGAFKGEGVAIFTATQSGGRGAPANGGGGGNNHNNSGGGGANLNAGGIGGGNSSSGVACTATRRGEPGKSMSSWNGQKIFMGGGGGAGHSNNGLTIVSGGNGGGIIFLWANNLIGNSELISANGGKGGNSLSDGAGGGGAGGSIIMHITNYVGAVIIQTSGGNGGTSDNGGNLNRCFGGGGGGSGGAIYFTGSIPSATITENGGAAGLELSRDATCSPTIQAASAGSNGQTFSNYTFSRSTATAGYCRLLLPVEFVAFTASAIDKKVLLDWEIDNLESLKLSVVERSVTANQWVQLKTIAGNEHTHHYTSIDNDPLPGRNYYRIKFIDKKNVVSYSPVRQIITGNENAFIVYPNPARDKIIVTGNFSSFASIRLLDLTGKVILQKINQHSPAIINLPVLPAGVYILRVNQVVQKIIIH